MRRTGGGGSGAGRAGQRPGGALAVGVGLSPRASMPRHGWWLVSIHVTSIASRHSAAHLKEF